MITNNEENKNNNIKRRQHYIPQAYLRFFATKGKKEHLIWVYDCSNDSIKRVSINNICVINDLYECKYFSDECNDWIFEDINSIENHFVYYEGTYTEKVEFIIDSCKTENNTKLNLNIKDKEFFAVFVAQILLRNQLFVTIIRDLALTPTMISEMTEELSIKYPDIEKGFFQNMFRSKMMKDFFYTDGKYSFIKAYSNVYLKDKICFLYSKNKKFITSDAPVVNVFGCKNDIEYDLVGMPISPELFLAFIDSSLQEDYEYSVIEIDDSIVELLNSYQNNRKAVKYLFSK